MLDAELRIRRLDASGSTLGLWNAASPQSGLATTYTYDPSGTPTASGAANEWPFQYQGREKEFTDPAPYYYSGSGQFYSPQFIRSLSEAGQTSASGAGSGGFSPSGMMFPSPSGSSGGLSPQSLGNDSQQALQVGEDIYNVANSIPITYEESPIALPLALIGGTIDFLVNFFEDIFGGGGSPETPRQLLHGRHPLYPVILGLPDGLIPSPGPGSSGTPQFCEVAGPAPCPNARPLSNDQPFPPHITAMCQDNGNLGGTFSHQDYICSSPAGFLNKYPCAQLCCYVHDMCYSSFQCNQSSWIPLCGGACQACNADVLQCMAECTGSAL